MTTIGITGGIGSGKSYICGILIQMNIPIYDSDSRAKALYDEDLQLKDRMIELIGDKLYDTPTGQIDRSFLAQQIFSDQELLNRVNALVHPAVRKDIDLWKQKQALLGFDIVGIESALLLNSPMLLSRIDLSITISAPIELRLKRAMQRDGSDEASILKRMDAQMSQQEMEDKADYTIYNDGKESLLPQIIRIIDNITNRQN